MYRNALIATDGSDTAAAVYQHVRHIVDPEGTVTIVEVVDDVAHVFARATPAGYSLGAGLLEPSLAERIVTSQRAAAERHLAEARAVLEQDGLRNIVTKVLDGRPGEAIVREVTESGCDVVLMGTHGRSGLRRTVLGSVADHVLRHLDGIPVLLLHGNE
ncbi:MAG: universal stress protein [Dehalococcoidia bacterium]|nr:universal stress protein [Dehalococcoidia bacterium]